jgi:trans-aconitate methyltransferase
VTGPSSQSKIAWDAELYEARHGFVWQFGEGVVQLLNPQPGERILDLGCGPGQLTHRIAEAGAEVVGLDASPAMIGQARQNFPKLRFVLEDAVRMTFQNEFDAVFSNAALHWMLDASGVARAVARALRTDGRFVAEMGGYGNIQQIEGAARSVLARYTDAVPASRNYFPSVAAYAAILEAQGLEVRMAQLFDRPTPLEGPAGMATWIRQFKWFYFEALPAPQQEQALAETVEQLRPALLRSGIWYADYRRLRIVAVKV